MRVGAHWFELPHKTHSAESGLSGGEFENTSKLWQPEPFAPSIVPTLASAETRVSTS